MEINRLDIAKQIINDNITDPSMSEAEKFNAIGQQLLPIQELMSYYRCALMEVERNLLKAFSQNCNEKAYL